jgi:hypothetical protein
MVDVLTAEQRHINVSRIQTHNVKARSIAFDSLQFGFCTLFVSTLQQIRWHFAGTLTRHQTVWNRR